MRQESYDFMVKNGSKFMTMYAPVLVYLSANYEIYEDFFLPTTIFWILALLAFFWAHIVDKNGIMYRVLVTFGAAVQVIMVCTFLGRGGKLW